MSSDNTRTWLSIPSTDPIPFRAHHLPRAVRDFHMMGRVIFYSPTCEMHKEAMLAAYVRTLDVTGIRAVADYCRPYLAHVTEDMSAEKHVQWLAVLVTLVPLPASAIPAETIDLLVHDIQWRSVIHSCPGCQEELRRSEESW